MGWKYMLKNRFFFIFFLFSTTPRALQLVFHNIQMITRKKSKTLKLDWTINYWIKYISCSKIERKSRTSDDLCITFLHVFFWSIFRSLWNYSKSALNKPIKTTRGQNFGPLALIYTAWTQYPIYAITNYMINISILVSCKEGQRRLIIYFECLKHG